MQDPTRSAAFDLVAAVLDHRIPLDESLARLPEMEWRNRAAAHRLAATVLRRLGSLDAVLERHVRKAPPEAVRQVLRIGAAGLLLLETPSHAAVGTAVELARERGLSPFAGLVNAVLRRVADSGRATLEELDGPRLDTPPWLWASWGAEARAIAMAHQLPPPLDLSFRKPEIADYEDGKRLPNGSIRMPNGTRVVDLPGLAKGAFWVQDVAATFPARLLNVRSGEVVADLCAAPGGKTAQLVAAGARVVAVERDPQRAERLRQNLRRLKLKAEIVEADAAEWSPPMEFDAVLLDAPCSATGTIRRHPDIPRIKRPRDVTLMTEVQDRLLASMGQKLRAGGRLIYAVCSLQPEEGASRVERLLRQGGWRLAPFARSELPDLPEAITTEGYFRTHPGMWAELGGMDGFFAARLVRT